MTIIAPRLGLPVGTASMQVIFPHAPRMAPLLISERGSCYCRRRGAPYIHKCKFKNNRPILSLVERGRRVRSFHLPIADRESVE
jgi:hypothetical protein